MCALGGALALSLCQYHDGAFSHFVTGYIRHDFQKLKKYAHR